MKVTYDPEKRAKTLAERGLDLKMLCMSSPERPSITSMTGMIMPRNAGLRLGG